MKKSKVWLSDLVGEDYKRWNKESIIFNCGTGCGKTTFVVKILTPYAKQQGKRILYLCNRKALFNQLEPDIGDIENVDLMLYQKLQQILRKDEYIKPYDYIVADECHYLYSDAIFNDYTDLSYKFLLEQQDNVVIFMSATADMFFKQLQTSGIVNRKNVYTIPKDYSYVHKVYFYKADDITNVIDDIIERHPEDKIIVFVNGISRLKEMHDVYSDIAYFICSKSSKKNAPFCNNDCIRESGGKITFDRKILFSTKVLDNGVDIKDEQIRHVFSEIFDVDSAIQALGRKRPINDADYCSFYLKKYDKRALKIYLEKNEQQLVPVEEYLKDKESFIEKLLQENENPRDFARKNKIMYTDWEDNEQIKINTVCFNKYRSDNTCINAMITSGYQTVMLSFLGKQLTKKVEVLEIVQHQKDVFLEYLVSICEKKLFKDEKEVLKDKFRNILGLKDRTMGINTLNGKLIDCQYPYMIISERERSRNSQNRDRMYWMVVENKKRGKKSA